MAYIMGTNHIQTLMEEQREYGRAQMTETERMAPNPLQEKFNGRKVYVDGHGWGIITGGFLNDQNKLHFFNAFHVRFNNGTTTTIEAIRIIKMTRK